MLNLLRAGFFRYLHSTAFKICSSLTVVFAALFSWRAYKATELNELWFMFGTLMITVLITFVVGNETSSCIKNKLAAGYTKTQVYFSEIILANIFALIYFSVFFVFFVVGNFYIIEHTPLFISFQVVFAFAAMTLLLASVFCSIACAISSKTVPSIVCLVLVIVLSITSLVVVEALNITEFQKFATDKNGEWVYWQEKNPNYVDEPLRSLLTFYRDVNPYGQCAEYEKILLPFLYYDEKWEEAKEATKNTIGNDFLKREISDVERKYLIKTPFVTLIPIPVFVIAGWLIFKKKEFK